MKRKIDVSAIVEALEFQSQEGRAFLDRETGEIHQFGPEELALGDDDDPLDNLADWQQPLVELARQVLSDSSDRFVELPDMWDVHEYRALERFAANQTDPDVADELRSAISGRGAFRLFKDAVHRLGIADRWYVYRNDFLLEIARDWCHENDVPYTSPGT